MSMTAAELLEAALDGTLQEDDALTTSQPNTESAPAPTVTAAPDAQATQQAGATETEVEGAPILSKSGAYTIPYEKLAEAREGRKAALDRVAQLEQQVAALTSQQQQNLATAQADAQDRAAAGQSQTAADANLAAATQAMESGVDIAIFGDFSEEALANGVAELNRRAMEQIRAEMRETIRREFAPLREQEAKTATQSHYDAIYSAHPDADEIVDSTEFAAWRNSLPAFARAGVDTAMKGGSAQEVVEVFNAFRGIAKQQPQPNTARNAPEALPLRVPNSLSDVPGSAPTDAAAQTLAIAGNSGALLDRMSSMTAAQIDALMDKI